MIFKPLDCRFVVRGRAFNGGRKQKKHNLRSRSGWAILTKAFGQKKLGRGTWDTHLEPNALQYAGEKNTGGRFGGASGGGGRRQWKRAAELS